MIVRQFLHWVRTAPAAERADATSALARAYLYSELTPDDRAAVAEVGAAEACLMLIENPQAAIATFSLDRMVARFGHLGAIREAMLAREHLPASTHQALVAKLSETLADFVAAREWLEQDHAL